jgi:hypothetical protein
MVFAHMSGCNLTPKPTATISFVQGVQAKFIPGYEDSTRIRPKHYEIWFALDAFK